MLVILPEHTTCSQVACCSSEVRYEVQYSQECIVLSSTREIQSFVRPVVTVHTGHMPLESCRHVCAFVPYPGMLLCNSIRDKLAIIPLVKEKQVGALPYSFLALTNFSKILHPSLHPSIHPPTEHKLSLCDLCLSM